MAVYLGSNQVSMIGGRDTSVTSPFEDVSGDFIQYISSDVFSAVKDSTTGVIHIYMSGTADPNTLASESVLKYTGQGYVPTDLFAMVQGESGSGLDISTCSDGRNFTPWIQPFDEWFFSTSFVL